MREHNRVVDILRGANPTWSVNKLYQEAKRITIGRYIFFCYLVHKYKNYYELLSEEYCWKNVIFLAQFQHILYNEFLPLLVGRKTMREFDIEPKRRGYKRQYNPNIDPTIQVKDGFIFLSTRLLIFFYFLKNMTECICNSWIPIWSFNVTRYFSNYKWKWRCCAKNGSKWCHFPNQ